MIYYDRKTRCYTDGKNYAHSSTIRDYAIQRLGKKPSSGRLSREVIATFFLDIFNVNEEVA